MKEILLGVAICSLLGALGCFLLILEDRMDVLEAMHGIDDAPAPPPPDGHYLYRSRVTYTPRKVYIPLRPRTIYDMETGDYPLLPERPPEPPDDEADADEEETIIIEDGGDVEIESPSDPEPEA